MRSDTAGSGPRRPARLPIAPLLALALAAGCGAADPAAPPARVAPVDARAGSARQLDASRGAPGSPPSLTLVGTLVLDDPAESMATIRVGTPGPVRAFRPGDAVAPGIGLVSVHARRALLLDGDRLRTLRLVTGGSPEPGPPPASAKEMAAEAEELLYANAPVIPVSLDRDALRRALGDRLDLDRRLEPGELYLGDDFEDQRLLRLSGVAPGDLYDQLGLRAGDVLVMVDAELLLNRADRLFDALLRGPRPTRLRILRQGAPSTVEIAVR